MNNIVYFLFSRFSINCIHPKIGWKTHETHRYGIILTLLIASWSVIYPLIKSGYCTLQEFVVIHFTFSYIKIYINYIYTVYIHYNIYIYTLHIYSIYTYIKYIYIYTYIYKWHINDKDKCRNIFQICFFLDYLYCMCICIYIYTYIYIYI